MANYYIALSSGSDDTKESIANNTQGYYIRSKVL
jgi:hypothetical protein